MDNTLPQGTSAKPPQGMWPVPVRFLLSVIYWGLSFSTLTVMAIPALLLRPLIEKLDPRIRPTIVYARTWAWATFQLMGVLGAWKTRWTDAKSPHPYPCIYVSNHMSQLDITLCMGSPLTFNWVSKRSVFAVPGFGWGLFARGDIGLKRDKASSIKKMLKLCKVKLALGNAVWIFPEGNRSEDGHLRNFKSGAFVLAKLAKVPIVPVAISGTNDGMRKGKLVVGAPAEIEMRVLEAISADEVKATHAKELALHAHNQIAEALHGMRGWV